MSDELKWGLLLTTGFVALVGILCYSWAYNRELDARAPIIETCVKHPATVAPFSGSY